jgi:hypothetical protein
MRRVSEGQQACRGPATYRSRCKGMEDSFKEGWLRSPRVLATRCGAGGGVQEPRAERLLLLKVIHHGLWGSAEDSTVSTQGRHRG